MVPSLVPGESEWKLVWADEFDGSELDRTKWDYRLEMMHRRHKTWTDDAVYLDGCSNAVFRIYERDGEVLSSHLQTGSNFMDPPAQEECTADGMTWAGLPPSGSSGFSTASATTNAGAACSAIRAGGAPSGSKAPPSDVALNRHLPVWKWTSWSPLSQVK